MNYLIVELGFYFTAFYMLILAVVVASVLCTLARRRLRHNAAERFERARRERARMEMVRWFAGCARDHSYKVRVDA